jgi:hypothetical protein
LGVNVNGINPQDLKIILKKIKKKIGKILTLLPTCCLIKENDK